jgi:hypothetical protein
MITYIIGTSSLALSIQKILLDFKRCGDQLAIMSLKQLNDLSQNKVAFVSLDRLAYTYAKMLGVCTSIRVGVAGAYFEEPDGDDKPNGIEYINESGHNYNLWFHRTEVAKTTVSAQASPSYILGISSLPPYFSGSSSACLCAQQR